MPEAPGSELFKIIEHIKPHFKLGVNKSRAESKRDGFQRKTIPLVKRGESSELSDKRAG
jgi:hypothetical protein